MDGAPLEGVGDRRDDERAAPPDDAHTGSTTRPQDTMVVHDLSPRTPPLHTDPGHHDQSKSQQWTMTLTIALSLLALAILWRYCIGG